ncbi:MAG: ACT domain-containing protein [Candidatus Aminicenantes bacterium]|nr:ACT domain-containing protein [Candidatus Aminicenantes bacterium]
MSGIKVLDKLLKEMTPSLSSEEYVFCSLEESAFDPLRIVPLMTFKEEEGLTVILEKKQAEANNLSYSGSWAKITLNIHSDLEAVGFLAKISTALAERGISVNVVSAYYHDHLFVPSHQAPKALAVLEDLSKFKAR